MIKSIRQFFSQKKLDYKVIRKIKKNAIFVGNDHKFTIFSRISLTHGAKKENVRIENGVWLEGKILVQDKGKVTIHEHAKISTTTVIMCCNCVEIGAYTAIAEQTSIIDNNNHPISPSYRKKMRLTPENDLMRTWKYSDNAPIKIGENVWIGSHVRICKGVTIGNNSVIGACSVVTKNIPENCVAVGNPARVVKTNIDKLPEPEFP